MTYMQFQNTNNKNIITKSTYIYIYIQIHNIIMFKVSFSIRFNFHKNIYLTPKKYMLKVRL